MSEMTRFEEIREGKKKEGIGPFGVSDEEVQKLREEMKEEKVRPSTKLKRALFLRVMRKTTNISISCAVAEISRRTFERWLKKSKSFRNQYENILESKIDFAESALFLAAGSREKWAVLEILRSRRGKARGYGRTFELEGPDGGPIPVKLYEGVDDSKFPKANEEGGRE